MKKTRSFILIYFLPFALTEILFRLQAGHITNVSFVVRSLLFSLFIASILWSLNQIFNNRIIKSITVFFYLLFPIYGLFQVAMSQYYGLMFSIRILLKGMPDVGSYAGDFLKSLKPEMILFLVIPALAIYFYLKHKQTQTHLLRTTRFNLISIALVLSMFVSYIGSLIILEPANTFVKSLELFKNPYLTEVSANQLGVSALLLSDLQYLVFPERTGIDEGIIEKPKPPVIEEPNLYANRKFEDSEWNSVRDSEENSTLKALDSYFLNKAIAPVNDATGKYKGKNFIYILTEAFDMVAIHPKLTPTLYKLKQEGTYMDNFYSTQYNCATAESELISVTSVYPVIGTCTMSAYYEAASSQSVYKLFKDAGYKTSSYHNWNDQFYPRTKIHPTLGSDKYLDYDALIPKMISGWQSDLTMMKGIVKDLNASSDPFMGYIITSSTHLPYDIPSNLGKKYVNEVLKVFPEAPLEIRTYLSKAMELDKAMEYLLENLDDIDNTVIAMFSDHRPLRMPNKYLDKYSDITRLADYELDRTPMMIYTPGQTPEVISKKASTIDMLPTIANLFDLKHDPRLFMGTDLFGKDDPIVIFHSGSWYDQVGYFNTKTSLFKPFNADITHTNEEVSSINAMVKQKLSVSSNLYTSNYFNKRTFLRGRSLVD